MYVSYQSGRSFSNYLIATINCVQIAYNWRFQTVSVTAGSVIVISRFVSLIRSQCTGMWWQVSNQLKATHWHRFSLFVCIALIGPLIVTNNGKEWLTGQRAQQVTFLQSCPSALWCVSLVIALLPLSCVECFVSRPSPKTSPIRVILPMCRIDLLRIATAFKWWHSCLVCVSLWWEVCILKLTLFGYSLMNDTSKETHAHWLFATVGILMPDWANC